MAEARTLWGLEWRSVTRADGQCRHLINEHCIPVLFTTRRAAREYAEAEYGYIRNRADLRAEPHGWRMPAPVRVRVQKVGDNA